MNVNLYDISVRIHVLGSFYSSKYQGAGNMAK